MPKRPSHPPGENRQPLLPTGVPNLDLLLGGGVPRGSLLLVVGPPGSGKTTLANQIAFAAAQAQARALIFTALSEPSGKLLAHLASFRFFVPELVGPRLRFLSLEQYMSGDLEQVSAALLAEVRRARASVVVLDGFRGMRAANLDPQAARQFLYEIGSALSVTGTTTIITCESDPHDPTFFPEATTADVIVGLHAQVRGLRLERHIEVIKLRGAPALTGLHSLVLTPDGLAVTPRLESRIRLSERLPQPAPDDPELWRRARARRASGPEARAAFGLPVLDALLEGGLIRSTSMLVLGPVGIGKTMLGVQFAVAGVSALEPTVYLSFRETPEQMALKVLPFAVGAPFESALRPEGPLRMVYWEPVEMAPDVVADHLLTTLDQLGARRLVVDSITELERAARESGDPARVQNYLAALVGSLRRRQVTSVFLREVAQGPEGQVDLEEEPVAVLAEHMLLLQLIARHNQRHRALSVAKRRFGAADPTAWQEVRITVPDGFTVRGPLGEGSD